MCEILCSASSDVNVYMLFNLPSSFCKSDHIYFDQNTWFDENIFQEGYSFDYKILECQMLHKILIMISVVPQALHENTKLLNCC